jgi:hypothetical protein
MLGRLAIYQVTGGPAQIVGGDAASENILLQQLDRESRFLEHRLRALVASLPFARSVAREYDPL